MTITMLIMKSAKKETVLYGFIPEQGCGSPTESPLRSISKVWNTLELMG